MNIDDPAATAEELGLTASELNRLTEDKQHFLARAAGMVQEARGERDG